MTDQDSRPGSETVGDDGIVRTFRHGPSDPPKLADVPGTRVETLIDADLDTVWATVTDINAPAQFSTEFLGATWVTGGGPALGARFRGRNRHEAIGEWEADLFVHRYEPMREFGWITTDPDNPGSSWCFVLEPQDDGVRLRFEMELGPGPNGLTAVLESMPSEMEPRVVRRRVGEHHANMVRTVDGIRGLAESR